MNYQETINYLYESAPMFQQVGSKAYKEGLENTHTLDNYFGHPHCAYKTIHIGGTNGKGSCSHTIAAILQSAGYRVGLYTSPHLIDFRERIRINGKMISEEYVIEFVEQHKSFFESLSPSFFELTTAIAFRYFADEKVDIAIIEVGLGGRLDCTNIINPVLSIITNISLDHTQFLGNSLAQIAIEKAGIIKSNVPVIIGENNIETKPIFKEIAKKKGASIVFAEDSSHLKSCDSKKKSWFFETKKYGEIKGELAGLCQIKNANTILHAIEVLKECGFSIDTQAIKTGFESVCKLTGLMGRWQKLSSSPLLICDTGHNKGGIEYIVQQLANLNYTTLHFVIGMVNDKDIDSVLDLLPKDAIYYFTKASISRALNENELMHKALNKGLKGSSFATVTEAMNAVKKECLPEDTIFVGGSTFIVADLLSDSNTFNFD